MTAAVLPAIAPSATASASTAVATPAATSAAFCLGPSLVDVDRASANLRSIQSSDGFFSILVAGHLHKSEAARTAGVAVGHDAHAVDLSVGLEQLPQFVFVGIEAEIPHKDILHASAPALSCRKCELTSADLAGREGLPENRYRSWQQSIAASSIAGFPKLACQIVFVESGQSLEEISTRLLSNSLRDESPSAAGGFWDHGACHSRGRSKSGSKPFLDDRSSRRRQTWCRNCKG